LKFRYYITAFLLLISPKFFGQDTLRFNFNPIFNGKPLVAGERYFTENNDSIQVAIFRMYVSGFRLYKDGKEVYAVKDSYYLLDIAKPESFCRTAQIPQNLQFDAMRFYFGIDDITNNKGIGDGDLDPANDMYWAWQTGYINMKLEGTYGKNRKPFEFHLGGFLKPYTSFTEVRLAAKSNFINLGIDLGTFFQHVFLNSVSAVMSPGKSGVELSGTAAQMFTAP
jgi:hypothetical protein